MIEYGHRAETKFRDITALHVSKGFFLKHSHTSGVTLMQKAFKLAALAALCSAALAAHAGVAVDANIETNTDFHKKDASHDSVSNGGRVEVNANAAIAKNGDFFVNARGTVGLTTNGDTYVDDAWVQAGNSGMDIKVGRFEAADLFPLGKDVAANIGTVGYKANTLRGRMKDGRLHAALGLNAGSAVRVELGLVTERQGKGGNFGVRPVVVYAAGPLTLRAGVESIKTDDVSGSTTGVGVSAGYAISDSASANVNYSNNSKLKSSSIGVNATFGNAGVGYIGGNDKMSGIKSTSVYAAYTFSLFGVKGASITPAVGVYKQTGSKSDNSLRVRINYAF